MLDQVNSSPDLRAYHISIRSPCESRLCLQSAHGDDAAPPLPAAQDGQ